MLAITLAVNPRANSQRKCQRLRSTGSFVLRCAPVVSFEFLGGQVRFKRDASCHASVLQGCDTTRYHNSSVLVLDVCGSAWATSGTTWRSGCARAAVGGRRCESSNKKGVYNSSRKC